MPINNIASDLMYISPIFVGLRSSVGLQLPVGGRRSSRDSRTCDRVT